MRINKRIYHKKRFWAGILLVQIFLFYLCSKVNFLIPFYVQFFEFHKKIHQQIFSVFPFSVGDLLYVLLGIGILFIIIKIAKKNSRDNYIKVALISCNVFYFTYQIFWGMLYFTKPIIHSLPNKIENPEKAAKILALRYLEKCKVSRNLVKENNDGVFIINDLESFRKEIIDRQKDLPAFFSKGKSADISAIKPSLYKNLISYTGILGYYNPFTSEAQFNSDLPATYLPFTMAHESMHQFGIAREQEANFGAYLIGIKSKNSDLKYSTEYYVLKSLLGSLAEKNPEFVKDVIENYSSKMKKDRQFEIDFRKKHQSFLIDFFGYTNDLFLKSNQQEGSITYSYFIDLLLHFEYKNIE